ncbi:MAG: rhodanese-like domain-containing protein [Giesbergeria sp.]|uniref:rhodanese-like domain-containing protein n=1 Tax=Giesbergeria sp. TaxID=2818473 RepID=UPI002610CCF0|nr:rhodanese-like domain-containing protein [Giesbergeria sp.]MDD2609861.1 rhodanese-like domain-containing protein [Giesbergeria sp.]
MKRRLLPVLLLAFSGFLGATEIGITAQETLQKVQSADKAVLFVDVRDPVEIMFVGFTDAVHVNIPFLQVYRERWDAQRGTFALERNPQFVEHIRKALRERGMADDAEIITLCRSGSERGEPSAAFLRANGFPNARYVVKGFQGDSQKDGPQKGLRTLNGWQNSGLPWSSKMNAEKMYRLDRS